MARAKRATTVAKSYKEVEDDQDDGWDSSDDDQKKTAAGGAKRKAAKAAERNDQHAAPARKRQHTAATNVDLHDLSLLDIILKHSNAIDKAVEEWIERYKDNRAAAAAELMTLLVQVAGCDQEVTEEEVEGGEVDQLASRLCEAVEEEGGVEVLRSARSGRAFATHYCTFWDRLLRGLAAADLLFDDFELNDKLVRLVTALNISTVRSFRHAATLTAAQLVSSWITVSAGLTKSRELAKFQLDAEEKKKSKGGAGMNPAAAALRRTLDRCHARVEDLKNFRSVTFTGVFSHRFRDVDDGIRAIVIESIGRWIAELPTEFLADTYLKYLGWALSDKSAGVRSKAVAAIAALYEDSENVPRLHEFAARFTTRFIELMSDVDEAVAAEALHLLAQLVQHGVLKHEAVSDVFKVLSQEHAGLRRAAAGLAVQLLEEHGRASVSKAADALKATADAAGDGRGAAAGRSKGAKGKAGSKGKAAGQSAAAVAAAAMLQDAQQLQLAGLLAVMAGMSPQAGNVAVAEEASQSAAAGPGAVLPTLSLLRVVDLVDALWEHMPQVLGDVGALADHLADEGAGELRGRQGNANLAALLAGAVYRSVHPPAAGRKGRGRAARDAAPAAAGGVDAEAQQEVALSQKLPALLTQFQAEPAVAAPLLAIPSLLRLEQFLLSKQEEGYRALLQQADGLLQRHSHLPLVNEAAAVLVHASKNGPAALQEIGHQVLHSSCATSAAKLASAAAAVGKLRANELAEGVADLAVSPAEAPDALLSLLAALQRVRVLVTAGAEELSRDKQVAKACQTLLQQSLAGRELGPEIMQLLLHTTNTSLLWQQRSAQHSAAAVPAFVQSRTNFMRVLEALLDSGAAEQLVRPEQILQDGNAAGVAAGGGLGLAGNEGSEELAEQVSAGIPTLQDLAARLLLDHVFLAGSLASLAGNAAAGGGEDGAGSSEAAAALAAAAPKLLPSMSLLHKLWRYCLSVLDREGPDEETLAAAEEAADEEDEEEDDLGGAADIDGWDVEGAATRRAARRAARRELLLAAALRLSLLRRSAVQGLVALVGFRAVPEPGFSWLLARLVTLLEGRQPAIASTVRVMLQQLKASAPEAAPQHFLAALKALYEEAIGEESAGQEEHTGDALQHLAAVSYRVASLYTGHNLSQGPLRNMFTAGITWALEDPASRALFLPTCLGPFTAKLAAAEAGQVAGQLQQQLAAAEAALQSGEAAAEDEEALEELRGFLKALQDRAAGKTGKATRGVLKTPGRAAAGEASDEDADAAADEDGGSAGAAAAKQAGKKKAPGRGRVIKFAADVELQPDDEGEGAAAAGGSSKSRAGRKRAAAGAAAAGSSKRARRQQQQDADDEWDDMPAEMPEQQQGSDSSGGWHTKRSSSSSPAAKQRQSPARQQRGGARGRQQQKGASAAPAAAAAARDAAAAMEEEEDAIEEYEEAPAAVQPRTTARQRATGARQASAVPARSARADFKVIDQDAGPLNSQSQSQSQSRGRRGDAAAAGRSSRRGAAAAVVQEEEQTEQLQEEEEQQQHDEDEDMEDAAADLAADTDDDDNDAAADEQQDAYEDDENAEEEEEDEDEQQQQQLYADSEAEEDEEQQPEASQFSEPLQSLNLVLEDLPDEEDDADGGVVVDEPPPTRRQGRRRR